MSYKDFQAFTAENCRGYKKIFEIGIGGFLYLAFLPDAYHKILCISSDYMSIIDSENGQVIPIDGDYYGNPGNEGHIFAQMKNITDQEVVLEVGERVVQAVFAPFLIADGDEAEGVRTGGFGSTGH